MASKPLFTGLVIDDRGEPVDIAQVGGEWFYVVDDDGFRRHVESAQIDRQVLEHLRSLMEGHESLVADGTMRMLGQEDIFTKAAIEASLKNLEDRFDELIEHGFPDDVRLSLGMMGFQIVVDIHGDVIRVDQPAIDDDASDGDG